MAVVDVERALTGAAAELGEAEGPRHFLALVSRLETDDVIEPAVNDVDVNDGVERAVHETARSEPRQRPEAVGRHRTFLQWLQQRLAERDLVLRVESLEA